MSPAPAPTPQPNLVFKTRYPSACKECRRRKQKCSLTQPCTNCARRFPQPTCEYGVEKNKRSPYAPASEPRNNASAAGGLYSHLDMESVRDALVEVEGPAAIGKLPGTPPVPTSFSDVVSPPSRSASPYFLMQGQTPDAERMLRLRFRDKGGVLAGQDIIELLQYILKTRLKVTNSIVKDEWYIDGAHLLRASQAASPPGVSLARFDHEIRHLPMAPTQMNKELVRTHLQLMSRFKASLDGSPRPNNRFMKHWIPYSIQDPLVLHVVLCSTASFLNETGRVPKAMLFLHRQTVMRMLNDQLANPHLCTNDSAMLAVAQMILTSWYWGSTQELHAHMAGFKRMILLRGGIQSLGMEGYTSKVALIDDFVIALAHETEPLMFGEPGFDFVDPFPEPLQVNFNSPLLFNCPPFLSPASSLRLHPHTAQILDNMRTLTKAVVELPDHPSDDQLDSLYSTAMSILSAVTHLPADVSLDVSPEPPRSEAATGPGCTTFGLKRKRQGDDTMAPRKAGTSEFDGRMATLEDAPDLVHRCVRRTALVYCYSIVHRVPTSKVCSEADFAQIWSCAWTVGLDRWSLLSGIFAWMMIAIVASSHQSIHGRMTKTLLVTAFMYIGTENWHVAVDMAEAALKLQRWLRGGKADVEDGVISAAFGGEQVIEKYGFAFKDFRDTLPPGFPDALEDEAEGAD
ncbi:fungal specific transcription factor [Hirsutella rhossiliensis]|uniref:Fungal specific transcription factor domain-containing protein n=1 Tax=Hirsutella rhossiliensis TaxID=111463 RepID=A0A9P8N4D2_9HYPO|nr:fungal specific transcription factor domain-containing protein [Hirsutella rhossiliensis]KAH0967408.1 fungal specific transcription factor domain-containing protein [Hirsutella rhossiliensis]